MFVGQVAVIGYFVLAAGRARLILAVIRVIGGGMTISLSVIFGPPAVLAATWIAIRPPARTRPFAEYLALRWTSWRNFLVGIASLALLVGCWDLLVARSGAR